MTSLIEVPLKKLYKTMKPITPAKKIFFFETDVILDSYTDSLASNIRHSDPLVSEENSNFSHAGPFVQASSFSGEGTSSLRQ